MELSVTQDGGELRPLVAVSPPPRTADFAALRWLFYIEGALTMFVALIAGVMLPDRLDNSRWFSEDELLVAKLRMAEDVSRFGASVVISQRDDAGG